MTEDNRSAKLFVGNLTYKVTKDDINNAFRPYGEIQDIKIIDKGRHVYGFVEFTNVGDAEEAYRELQGKDVRGTNLKIEYGQGPRNRTNSTAVQGTGNDENKTRERQECYQCGSTRHFKRDCPQLKKSRSRSRDNRDKKSKKKRSHRKRSSSSSRSRSPSSSVDKKQKRQKKRARSPSQSKSNSRS